MSSSQNSAIKKYLETGASITPIEALNQFGCFRLSARIYDLRSSGVPISRTDVKRNGKSFASYSISRAKSMQGVG